MSDRDPPRPAHLPAGYDEEDPYADEDLSTYPEWWRRNIEEFRRYGLRPYRPPRFADGEIAPEVIVELEAELAVDVRFQTINPHEDERNQWELLVDGERVATMERRRVSEGYSRYEITSEEFERVVRTAADE